MTRHMLWNRRTFLQRLGYLSGLGIVGLHTSWSFCEVRQQAHDIHTAAGKPGPLFAYVASWEHGIQVFAIEGSTWKLMQAIASDKPSGLALHPALKILYAVNEIDEYRGLPTGTVEAYSVDAYDGKLALLNRQPLSLSAIGARHLAVSPDGSNLIVAAYGGGSYNVLPIRADGLLESVSGILKEVGSGPDPDRQSSAHPRMLLFDTTGHHLLSTDLGSDRLNVFTLAENRLIVAGRRTMMPGSGPHSLALHPSGRVLYGLNELNASVSSFAYDATNGRIQQLLHHDHIQTEVSSKGAVTTAMAMHSSGNFLYTSSSYLSASDSRIGRIAAWNIDPINGSLRLIQQSNKLIKSAHIESMVPTSNGLFVLSQTEGVCRLQLDPVSGLLGDAVRVAHISAPKGMVLRYL